MEYERVWQRIVASDTHARAHTADVHDGRRALDGDDGSEIEFTGLERLSTTTMGAMGFSR